MENPEEILHSLEEFSKLKPKDIPRELEDYLNFVAKTGDPVYQWPTIKNLFREKLVNVITEFYESCPSVEIPLCPNVDVFNYETMKVFILEKLDTFAAAPFTIQRICELLTAPRKQYNRIDKYMRALEKNILVVSTTEPGNRHSSENGDGIVNGLESEYASDANNSNDINVEEMDDTPAWPRVAPDATAYQNSDNNINIELQPQEAMKAIQDTFSAETRAADTPCGSGIDSVITCRTTEQQPYVSIEPVASDSCTREDTIQESDVTVTITAIPAPVQKRRDSIEPVVSSAEQIAEPASTDFIEADVVKTNEAETTSNIEDITENSSPIETTFVPEECASEIDSTSIASPQADSEPSQSSCTTSEEAVAEDPICSNILISTTSEILPCEQSPMVDNLVESEAAVEVSSIPETDSEHSTMSSEELLSEAGSTTEETSEVSRTATTSECADVETSETPCVQEKDELISSSNEVCVEPVQSRPEDDLGQGDADTSVVLEEPAVPLLASPLVTNSGDSECGSGESHAEVESPENVDITEPVSNSEESRLMDGERSPMDRESSPMDGGRSPMDGESSLMDGESSPMEVDTAEDSLPVKGDEGSS